MAVMKMKVMVGINKTGRNTFEPIHNSIVMDKGVRVSKRLTMKKKQKAGVSCSIKKLHRTVEFAKSPIQYSNPSHKLLFLTGLELTPKEGVMMPPYVLLERLQPACNPVMPKIPLLMQTSKQCQQSQPLDEIVPEIQLSDSDSDVEDLDLELLVYPLDIPEFLEEICEKPRKCRPLHTTSTSMSSNNNTKSAPSSTGIKQRLSPNNPAGSNLPIKHREQHFYTNRLCSSSPEILVIDITQDSEADLF